LGGEVEDRQRLLPADALKSVEEVVECLTGGKAVKEVLNRHSCAIKAWGSTDSIRLDPDDPEKRVPGLDFIPHEVRGVDRLDPLDERLACQHRQLDSSL
jgi:hypothetical protein